MDDYGEPKIGRFGLGFSNAYNYEDVPSIGSRNRILVLHPQVHFTDTKEPG